MEADRLAAMLVGWQATGAGGLSQRLTLALRHLLATGVMADGEALPTERALAAVLEVSRPTVSTSMADLRALGLVESRQGSGTRVAPSPERRSGIDLATPTPFDASHLASFTLGTTDLLTVSPPTGLDALGSTVGIETLRDRIAQRHRRSGRSAEAGNVLVTSGAHQALALVIATRVPVGGSVLIEEVTYDGLADLVRSLGAEVRTVRRNAGGVDPSDLDAQISAKRPDLIVLVGGVHSPTGVVSSAQRLDQVAAALDHHGVPVLVDGAGDDLSYGGPVPHLATRCEIAEVVSVGTLSKSAWAGLQIGWVITTREEVGRIAGYRTAALDHGPSVVAQLMAAQILESFDDMVDRRCEMLEVAARQMVLWLGEAMPDWQVVEPAGGLTVWAALPGTDASGFAGELERTGVRVRLGEASRADGGADPHIRLCFDRPPALLDEALDRLVSTWNART